MFIHHIGSVVNSINYASDRHVSMFIWKHEKHVSMLVSFYKLKGLLSNLVDNDTIIRV